MDSFADVVREVQTATKGEKEELKRALGWEQPSTNTRNRLWSVIVWAAAIILVGSFVVVGWEVHSGNAAIKPDWLLTMFTGILGFLTGYWSRVRFRRRTTLERRGSSSNAPQTVLSRAFT